MVRIAIALTAAVLAIALAAESASAKTSTQITIFKVTQAEGTVRVTFAGDQTAGCASRGVCGVSGTSTYTFGGKPKFGSIYMLRRGGRTRYVNGYLVTTATTLSEVSTAGSAERCVDRVGHAQEQLYFEPHSQRLRFFWRYFPDEDDVAEDEEFVLEDYGDPFDTRCAGPALRDLGESDALPVADLPYRPFRQHRGKLETSGSKPFSGGGFAGTVQWDLHYGIQRRSRDASGGFFAIR
jgi:hypothetical protein